MAIIHPKGSRMYWIIYNICSLEETLRAIGRIYICISYYGLSSHKWGHPVVRITKSRMNIRIQDWHSLLVLGGYMITRYSPITPRIKPIPSYVKGHAKGQFL